MGSLREIVNVTISNISIKTFFQVYISFRCRRIIRFEIDIAKIKIVYSIPNYSSSQISFNNTVINL